MKSKTIIMGLISNNYYSYYKVAIIKFGLLFKAFLLGSFNTQ